MKDGWFAFGMPGIGWVRVALASVEGLLEIVGLYIDVDPMFVTASDKRILDWPAAERRQWAIDTAPERAAPMAMITAERLRSLPLAELRAATEARLAGDDPFDAFRKIARQRGKALPNEHHRQVAEVYKAAVERRQPPLKAIENRWQVSRAAAAKYAKRARELGLLGWPERPGIAGYEAGRSPINRNAFPAGPATGAASRACVGQPAHWPLAGPEGPDSLAGNERLAVACGGARDCVGRSAWRDSHLAGRSDRRQ
jgi:hypothetical protein